MGGNDRRADDAIAAAARVHAHETLGFTIERAMASVSRKDMAAKTLRVSANSESRQLSFLT